MVTKTRVGNETVAHDVTVNIDSPKTNTRGKSGEREIFVQLLSRDQKYLINIFLA